MISKKAGQRPVPRQSPAVAELELLPNEHCSLNHFAERLKPRLARGIHLLSNFSGPLRVVFSFFPSFYPGVRSSKEYSRYRSSYRNINYVRSKQVNNLESVCSTQSFRGGAKHRVASERARSERQSRREQLGHTTGVGLQLPFPSTEG